ncbi:O-antigen ligase family protein [Carboxylicivirga linearis]|uniref:O-antigen ligase family protein n=1 Tax=Carboxylicivirga linearis TaxID=1628157 RepID=A0ABS5JQR9_9BACT|nr:O-antigen ligase family protein [Carboxylicivirga linearis]MBS2097107.1 O-antigen ligase family protein [Carboxylicivirga linearis]
MILILRILADILWFIKPVNISVNIILLIPFLRQIKRGKIRKSLLGQILKYMVLIFLLLFIVSYCRDISTGSTKLIFKIAFSFIMFYYGTQYKGDLEIFLKKICNFSIIGLITFFFLSFIPASYQNWGDKNTFVGLYYFKTDMALSIVIFLSFAIIDNIKKMYLFLLTIISLYLIIITNARIHLLSFFFLICLRVIPNSIFNNLRRKLLYVVPIFIFISLLFLKLYFEHIASADTLKVSFSEEELFSGENTQGRNVIWLSVLDGFFKENGINKIVGTHLLQDEEYVYKYSKLSHNAHNGYLFVLVSTGVIGLLLFLIIIFIIFDRLINLGQMMFDFNLLRKNEFSYKILFITIVHLFVFVITNLTNNSILFQQQTWFFMFFAGILYNKKVINQIINL